MDTSRLPTGSDCGAAGPLQGHHLLRSADGLAHADPGRSQALAGGVRELVGAGEPLDPEIIEQVRAAWGLTIGDGFGQTETTASPGAMPRTVSVPSPDPLRLSVPKAFVVLAADARADAATAAAILSYVPRFWEEDLSPGRQVD